MAMLCSCDKTEEPVESLRQAAKPDVKVSGQAFIVTEAKGNVKLALLRVYFFSPKAASDLLDDLYRLERKWTKEMQKSRDLALYEKELGREEAKFEKRLERLNAGTGAKDAAQRIQENYYKVCLRELTRVRKRIGSSPSDEEALVALADVMDKGLSRKAKKGGQVSMVQTDADGRFEVGIEAHKQFVYARSEREVGDSEEQYVWLHRITDENPMFLSNERLMDEAGSFYDSLADYAGSEKTYKDLIPSEPSPEIVTMIERCKSRLKDRRQSYEESLTKLKADQREEAASLAEKARRKAEAERAARIAQRSDGVDDEETFQARLEKLKELSKTNPSELEGYLEEIPDAQDLASPYATTPSSSEKKVEKKTFRISKTNRGAPHEKRETLNEILDRLNKNLKSEREGELSQEQFVELVKAGIPVRVVLTESESCRTCLGDGKLSALQESKDCPDCGSGYGVGTGKVAKKVVYEVTW